MKPIEKSVATGPTFTLRNRLFRLLWSLTWLVFARLSPPFMNRWRIFLLRLFGAKVSYKVIVYSSTKIWDPRNLIAYDYATLGPYVDCYCMATISLGTFCIVSKGVTLCTGFHNYEKQSFDLMSKEIVLGDYSWICASAFICPGVKVGVGSVIGAASVVTKDTEDWFVFAGNPCKKIKPRKKTILSS